MYVMYGSYKDLFLCFSVDVVTWLYPQHEELVSQMQPELEAVLARPIVEHSVDEGHDSGLHAEVVPVRAHAAVQLVHHALEPGPLARILLEVHHRF
jgi:hypothetical protein